METRILKTSQGYLVEATQTLRFLWRKEKIRYFLHEDGKFWNVDFSFPAFFKSKQAARRALERFQEARDGFLNATEV